MTSEGRIEMEAGSVRCRIEGLTAGTDSESVRLRTSEGLKAYEECKSILDNAVQEIETLTR